MGKSLREKGLFRSWCRVVPPPRSSDKSRFEDITQLLQRSLDKVFAAGYWTGDQTLLPPQPLCGLSLDYLAVILDAFSRKVVGWALNRTLATRLTVAALEQAIASRQPKPGLVHQSDRGFQYACAEYVAIIEKRGMVPSVSRPVNPYDNASCKRFMKTLKREEIYANRYDNLEHLRAIIEEFVERYYNRQRLHWALGYRSPEEFERESSRGNPAQPPGATVVFVVHDGNSENQERSSTELSGDEDSNAVLLPRPLLLLKDATKTE